MGGLGGQSVPALAGGLLDAYRAAPPTTHTPHTTHTHTHTLTPLIAPGCAPATGMAVWRATRPRPADWPVETGSVTWLTPQKPGCMTHTIGEDGAMLTWQAFSPWPVDRLEEIGGEGWGLGACRRCLQMQGPTVTTADSAGN